MFYLKPDVRNGKMRGYKLTSIDMSTDKKDGAIPMADYIDPTSETTKAKSGTSQGGLQFNSSGSWGYIECGYVDVYQGTKLFANNMSLSDGNKALAHSWVPGATEDERNYLPEALINKAGEWHYVTRVIKNDSISTYVDGVLKDKEIYAGWSEAGTVVVGKGFNVGYGYYTTSAETDDPIWVLGGGSTPILENDDSISIAPTLNGYELGDGKIGYNGNTNGMTIMEMLIDEGTTLSFGGQSLGMGDAFGYVTGTQTGTAIDNVAFYAEPLTNDQVAALYQKALQGDIEGPATVNPEPSPSAPVDPSQPAVSPSVVPTGAPSDVPTEVPSDEPTVTPSDVPTGVAVKLGDVDENGKVEIKDAQLTLKIALKIYTVEPNFPKFRLEVVDVNKDSKITLADAQAILKEALKITENFKEKK